MHRPKADCSARIVRAKSVLAFHVTWTERFGGEQFPQDMILAGFRSAGAAEQHILDTVEDVVEGSVLAFPIPATPQEVANGHL